MKIRYLNHSNGEKKGIDMHLNRPAPEPIGQIATMPSWLLQEKGYYKEVDIPGRVERIDRIFQKSGLLDFFSQSKGRRLNIVSLGAGESPELPLIDRYSKQMQFTYRYFALDNCKEVFSDADKHYRNESATFHFVDASDLSCIQEEIPILEEGSVDVMLILHPQIDEDPYPFWKMFLQVIPRLCKPDGMVLSSFVLHSELVKFYEFTKADVIKNIFLSIVCAETESYERYFFGAPHQWFATLKVKQDACKYVSHHFEEETGLLQDLFKRIVAAPLSSCFTLPELSDIPSERIIKKLEEAQTESLRLRKWTKDGRSNGRKPPYKLFIYENCDWYKKTL